MGRCVWQRSLGNCDGPRTKKLCPVACGKCQLCAGHPMLAAYAKLDARNDKKARRRSRKENKAPSPLESPPPPPPPPSPSPSTAPSASGSALSTLSTLWNRMSKLTAPSKRAAVTGMLESASAAPPTKRPQGWLIGGPLSFVSWGNWGRMSMDERKAGCRVSGELYSCNYKHAGRQYKQRFADRASHAHCRRHLHGLRRTASVETELQERFVAACRADHASLGVRERVVDGVTLLELGRANASFARAARPVVLPAGIGDVKLRYWSLVQPDDAFRAGAAREFADATVLLLARTSRTRATAGSYATLLVRGTTDSEHGLGADVRLWPTPIVMRAQDVRYTPGPNHTRTLRVNARARPRLTRMVALDSPACRVADLAYPGRDPRHDEREWAGWRRERCAGSPGAAHGGWAVPAHRLSPHALPRPTQRRSVRDARV